MRVCIRRGARQIGGTCIELESQGSRIVLDIGQPLDCPDAELADMPHVPGFEAADASLLGVVLSHRGYPSGAILLWETDESVPLQEMAVTPQKNPCQSTRLLLDGQQRLTSFCLTMDSRRTDCRRTDLTRWSLCGLLSPRHLQNSCKCRERGSAVYRTAGNAKNAEKGSG